MSRDIRTFDGMLPATFCRQLIQRFKKDKRVADDPQPDYSTRKYLELSRCKDWLADLGLVIEAANTVAEEYFRLPDSDELIVEEWADDGYIMAHYRPGDDLALHVDGQTSEEPINGLRLATVVFFLNDCQGGELEFPLQKVTVKPRQGRAVIFPPNFTHPHSVRKCKTDRFVVQTWLTDPYLKVVDR